MMATHENLIILEKNLCLSRHASLTQISVSIPLSSKTYTQVMSNVFKQKRNYHVKVEVDFIFQ